VLCACRFRFRCTVQISDRISLIVSPRRQIQSTRRVINPPAVWTLWTLKITTTTWINKQTFTSSGRRCLVELSITSCSSNNVRTPNVCDKPDKREMKTYKLLSAIYSRQSFYLHNDVMSLWSNNPQYSEFQCLLCTYTRIIHIIR